MKQVLWISFFIIISINIRAQSIASIRGTDVQINTIGENEVLLILDLDLKNDYKIWENTIVRKNKKVKYRVLSTVKKNILVDTSAFHKPEYGIDFIGFRFKTDSTLMNKIIQGDADYYIETTDTLRIPLINEKTGELDSCILTPQQVKEHTRNAIILSEEEKEELIQSAGGVPNIIANSVDFGLVPGEESSSGKTEYYLTYGYRTRYTFLKKAPLYFESSGHLSTNSEDSLNYLRIYPLSCNFLKGEFEFSGLVGSESNQVFTDWRISADISAKCIIPNFIDLTYGQNRLRLKPIIKAGIKGYQELRNTRSFDENKNVLSCEVYAEAYYYIPVYKQYSLTFQGNIFYDTNEEVNPDRKIKHLYSITAGVEIPNTGIQTIFKYTNGVIDVSDSQYSSTVMIGLLANLAGIGFD